MVTCTSATIGREPCNTTAAAVPSDPSRSDVSDPSIRPPATSEKPRDDRDSRPSSEVGPNLFQKGYRSSEYIHIKYYRMLYNMYE